MEADRKAVAALSATAREKLRPWAELNPETDAKKIEQMAISKLGDLEGIPLLIKTMRLDTDLSGEICEQEWSNYLESGQRMVDGTVNLALNCGVVGALILSILVPYSIERAELSEDGWSFLGDDHFLVVSWIFRAAFLICLNVAIVVSLLNVFVASLISVCLSSWAASLEFKIRWHVERVSTIRFQAVLMWQTLGWLIGTVFAGSLLADPMQGGIGLISLIFFQVLCDKILQREVFLARAALHREVVEFFEKAGGKEGGQ